MRERGRGGKGEWGRFWKVRTQRIFSIFVYSLEVQDRKKLSVF